MSGFVSAVHSEDSGIVLKLNGDVKLASLVRLPRDCALEMATPVGHLIKTFFFFSFLGPHMPHMEVPRG